MNESPTLEQVIASGKKVPIIPEGDSMKPLLNGKSDFVVLAKLERAPKKGDIILYRDYIERLVVHRVHHADTKNNKYYMLGDSNIKIEPPITQSEALGIVVSISRNAHNFSVKNPLYRLWAFVWSHMIKYRKAVLFRINGEYGFKNK